MTKAQLTQGIAVAAALAVIALFFIFNPFSSTDSNYSTNLNTPLGGSSTQTGSLVVQDLVVGTGAEAQTGDMLTLNYTGMLQDGSVFDTSVGKAPFKLILGEGLVIPGWEQGLLGMREGGKRILIVPPDLAYGSTGYGPIPPNATLTFQVELIKITPASNVAPIPEGEGM